MLIKLVEFSEEIVDLLGLEVRFALVVLVDHPGLLQVVHASIDLSCFKAHQSKGHIAFGRDHVVVAELLLEETLDDVQVLDGLQVVVLVDLRVHGLLDLQVSLHDELLPDLHDFREERTGLLDRVFFAEELAHVVITARQVNALGAVLLALQVDAVRQFFKCFGVCFRFVLS